jgi:hypothetical protein
MDELGAELDDKLARLEVELGLIFGQVSSM